MRNNLKITLATTLCLIVIVPFEVARYRNSCVALEEARACVEQLKLDQADVFAQVEVLKTTLNTWDFECSCAKVLLADGWELEYTFHDDSQGLCRVELVVTKEVPDEN